MSSWVELGVAFTTGIIGPLSLVYFKSVLNKNKNKPDVVINALRVSEVVEHKIDIIKEGLNADRVWITQFHNGSNFYPTGKSITKFSIVYESLNVGVISIQNNFKNIPVYLFSKSMNQLADSDTIEIMDYDDKNIPTYGLNSFSEEYGCKSSYLFSIKSIDGKFIGVLGVDYTKNKTQLDDDVINNVMIHVSSIGGVLTNYLEH